MAAFRRGTLFVPSLMQCRHRGKINIQRPRLGPIERRVFEAITQPVLLENLEDPNKYCARINRLNEDPLTNEIFQYEKIYTREIERIFNSHRMIAACQTLGLKRRDEFVIRNKLLNKGLKLKFMSNSHIRYVIEDSKFVNLLPLVQGRNRYIISEEPKIKELVDELKKIPQLVLLGGIVEDRILTREGFMTAAKLPSMDLVLGETCSLLSSSAAKTRSLLSSHQQSLSTSLEQYIKDRTEGDSSL